MSRVPSLRRYLVADRAFSVTRQLLPKEVRRLGSVNSAFVPLIPVELISSSRSRHLPIRLFLALFIRV